MSERARQIGEFLHLAGWEGAEILPLPGDASSRRYHRILLDGHSALLMDQPQQAETPPCPPEADAQARRALGYNAIARLAGADCGRFVAVSEFLRERRISAPEIYAVEPAAGFVLLEDFGDCLFNAEIAKGGDEALLYRTAVEMLAALHAERAPRELAPRVTLHGYDITALLAETDLMLDWYFPLALGRVASDMERDTHRGLWVDVLNQLGGQRPVFVHRDFHAQNLLWLPERDGIAQVGVIDFQDAVAGSPAYDLVSLLEDARRDVAPELAEAMVGHYISAMQAQDLPPDAAQLRMALGVMAAQRNAKIVGIFARLHSRDGKSRYLDYLPRVWTYLRRDLEHPALLPLKGWYEKVLPLAAREGRLDSVAA